MLKTIKEKTKYAVLYIVFGLFLTREERARVMVFERTDAAKAQLWEEIKQLRNWRAELHQEIIELSNKRNELSEWVN